MVPKWLLQVSVRELHNSLVSDPNDGGLQEARYEENNIIISNYTLRTLLLTQFKKKSAGYAVMCGCECWIYDKSIHSSLLSWRDWYLKDRNIKLSMLKTEGLVKNKICIYETYKIQWCHMKVILVPKHLIWKRLQYVHILSLIMYYLTRNFYFNVVINVHVSILLTKKWIISNHTQHTQ